MTDFSAQLVYAREKIRSTSSCLVVSGEVGCRVWNVTLGDVVF